MNQNKRKRETPRVLSLEAIEEEGEATRIRMRKFGGSVHVDVLYNFILYFPSNNQSTRILVLLQYGLLEKYVMPSHLMHFLIVFFLSLKKLIQNY